jgi:hypothetical protein
MVSNELNSQHIQSRQNHSVGLFADADGENAPIQQAFVCDLTGSLPSVTCLRAKKNLHSDIREGTIPTQNLQKMDEIAVWK